MKKLIATLTCALLCTAMQQPARIPPQTIAKASAKNIFAIIKSGSTSELTAALLKDKDLFQARDEANMTPLDLASQLGREDMVAILRNHEADVSLSDNNSECDISLHIAVLADDIAEVQRLLQDGTDPNSKDQLGRTALHLAALKGYAALAQLLLDNNAELNIQDNAGNTPKMTAEFAKHEDMVELLDNWQQDQPTDKSDDEDASLLDAALDVRAQNKTCPTPRAWREG